jgi:hypothetical protein
MATTTKQKTDEPAEETAAAPTVTLGQDLVVLVHPSEHAGASEAPGKVVRVVPDDDGGVSADMRVFGKIDRYLTGVRVVADRAAADRLLAEHFELLPGHTRDDTGRLIPGRNPRTGRDWERHDVVQWVPVAYPAG